MFAGMVSTPFLSRARLLNSSLCIYLWLFAQLDSIFIEFEISKSIRSFFTDQWGSYQLDIFLFCKSNIILYRTIFAYCFLDVSSISSVELTWFISVSGIWIGWILKCRRIHGSFHIFHKQQDVFRGRGRACWENSCSSVYRMGMGSLIWVTISATPIGKIQNIYGEFYISP